MNKNEVRLMSALSKLLQQVADDQADAGYVATLLEKAVLLGTPVMELWDKSLSVRSRRTLDQLNIKTFGQLVVLTEDDLATYKFSGSESRKEIRRKLVELGLDLRTA